MASRSKNISIDIGSYYSTNVYAYANGSATIPLDLAGLISGGGYANGHVKKSYYHSNTAATFNVWIQDETAGVVNLVLNHANTLGLSPGNYVYDVMIMDGGGTRTRIVEGIITATPGVSK